MKLSVLTSLRTLLIVLILLLVNACASRATLSGSSNAIGMSAPELATEVTPLRLIVIGGTSGTGLEVVKLALERNHEVTAVSRRPERLTFSHPNLSKAKTDITALEDIQRVIPGHDVIIVSVGLAAGSRNVTVFSEGIKNVLQVINETGQKRLIVVSAIGAGDSKGHGGFLFDNLLQPLILGDDIEDKTRMEEILNTNEQDFTIVRPAILTNAQAERNYRVIADLKGIETGSIARQDVAHFIVAIAEQNTYLQEAVTLSN